MRQLTVPQKVAALHDDFIDMTIYLCQSALNVYLFADVGQERHLDKVHLCSVVAYRYLKDVFT
jgi:hypothetical protein